MAVLSKKLNRRTKAQENFEAYLERGGSDSKKLAESYFAMREYLKRSKPAESEKYDRRLRGLYTRPQDPIAAGYVDKLKFEEAEKTAHEFKNVSLPLDPAKQKKAVEKKIQLLNQLTKELNEVVQVNSSEQIVASLNLLGEANQHMYNAIMKAPLPKGLNEKEIGMYKEGIKKISDPFLLKARESYKLAVARAQELEVYTQAYNQAYAYMNSLDPLGYYSNDEVTFDSRLVKWSVP